MKSILDRTFRYTSSERTDVRKTFTRVRREQQQLQEQTRARSKAEALSKVSPIRVTRHAAETLSTSTSKL